MSSYVVYAAVAKARIRWSKPGSVSTGSKKTGCPDEQDVRPGRQCSAGFPRRRSRSGTHGTVVQRCAPPERTGAHVRGELGRGFLSLLAAARRRVREKDSG